MQCKVSELTDNCFGVALICGENGNCVTFVNSSIILHVVL